MPVLSQIAPALVSVLQLVRTGVVVRIQSVREGAHAEGTRQMRGEADNCANITQPMSGEDLDD